MTISKHSRLFAFVEAVAQTAADAPDVLLTASPIEGEFEQLRDLFRIWTSLTCPEDREKVLYAARITAVDIAGAKTRP